MLSTAGKLGQRFTNRFLYIETLDVGRFAKTCRHHLEGKLGASRGHTKSDVCWERLAKERASR